MLFRSILMDISMPRMDGLEATRRIRAGGASRDVPVIGVTANASPDKLPEFLASGMTDVLVKPITRGSLLNAIEEHVASVRTARIATADPAPNPAVLNPQVFTETLEEMGRDFVQLLSGRLLHETANVIEQIRTLASAGNLAEAAAAAHKTAGAAAAIGLSGLYNALSAYERAANAGDATAAARCLDDITAMLPRTASVLADHGLSVGHT